MEHTRRSGVLCLAAFVLGCAAAGCRREPPLATDGAGVSRDVTGTAARMDPPLYRSRWDQVDGPWTTGWVPNVPFQGCIHRSGCNCGGNDHCGTYRDGDVTSYWPRGCDGPRWNIRCISVPQ